MSSSKQNDAMRNESEEHFLSFVAQTTLSKARPFQVMGC
jgi:hypothetical protein